MIWNKSSIDKTTPLSPRDCNLSHRAESRCEGPKDKRSSVLSMIYLSICFMLLGMFSSCELPHQPGPMPSVIIETEFERGLNIMGVLRADDEAGSSFININRALTTEEIYADSIPNFSPEVNHVKVSAMGSGSEHLFLRDEDSSDWGNYRDTTLIAIPGETYHIEIVAPGFPTLTGNTLIPANPQLVPNSLLSSSQEVSFQIEDAASAYEYKLYLFFTGTVLEKVVKPIDGEAIDIDWSFDGSLGSPLYLGLTALDENLTRYGNSPISFIPNTYHPDGSTVEGGYGCFGSIAISIIEL